MTKARDLANLGAVASGGLMFRNKIINGAMNIWQRGTGTFTTNGGFAADRWIVAATTLTGASLDTDVPTGFRNSLSVNGNGYPQIAQRVEAQNSTDLVGKDVTVSFWVKQTGGDASGGFGVQLFTVNTADTWSGGATQVGTAKVVSITSSWARYSVTFTSLPAAAANGIQISLYVNANSSCQFKICGVQVEAGSVATPFEFRPYGVELALCQRYYYKYLNDAGGSGYFLTLSAYSTTAAAGKLFDFPVTMRSAPTVVTNGSFTPLNAVGAATTAFTGTGNPFGNSYGCYAGGWTGSSGLTAGQSVIISMGGTAYIAASAEL